MCVGADCMEGLWVVGNVTCLCVRGRYAPVVDAACEVRGGVLAACLVWEVVACVEDIECSGPVDVGSRADGEGGALCDDVTKEEQCDAVHDVQRRG